MNNHKFKEAVKKTYIILFVFFGLLLIGASSIVYKMINPSFLTETNNNYKALISDEIYNKEDIKNGIHVPTGFIEGKGLKEVIISCTPCHSAKLVTQNRATKEGWIGIIRWMQDTQNLWSLGDNESVIVDYLATHYSPEEKGRRAPLQNIEWYNLDEN